MKQPEIQRMRDRFVADQPPGIRSFLEAYFRKLDHKFRKCRHSQNPWTDLPSWRVLPLMLARRYGRNSDGAVLPVGFLRDIRWGQYCLYLFIRFQDDLFDGQSHSPVSIYASDQCLFESERVFSRHFPKKSWFWGFFNDSLRITTQAIVEVDRRQQIGTTRPEQLLEGYARVGEILKVGSAAACATLNQRAAFRAVSHFSDEMAKAGQIADDFQDLSEDLERGRRNYAAAVINTLRKHSKHGTGRQQAFLDDLLFLAAKEHALTEAKKLVSNASELIGGLALPGMKKYIKEYRKALSKIETLSVRTRSPQGI
jgi:hypothetical protein